MYTDALKEIYPDDGFTTADWHITESTKAYIEKEITVFGKKVKCGGSIEIDEQNMDGKQWVEAILDFDID